MLKGGEEGTLMIRFTSNLSHKKYQTLCFTFFPEVNVHKNFTLEYQTGKKVNDIIPHIHVFVLFSSNNRVSDGWYQRLGF